jgi:hypothetical protein
MAAARIPPIQCLLSFEAQQARPGLARQRAPDPPLAARRSLAAPSLPVLETRHAGALGMCGVRRLAAPVARLNSQPKFKAEFAYTKLTDT